MKWNFDEFRSLTAEVINLTEAAFFSGGDDETKKKQALLISRL